MRMRRVGRDSDGDCSVYGEVNVDAERGFAESLRRHLENRDISSCQEQKGGQHDSRFTAVEDGIRGSRDLFLAHGTGTLVNMDKLLLKLHCQVLTSIARNWPPSLCCRWQSRREERLSHRQPNSCASVIYEGEILCGQEICHLICRPLRAVRLRICEDEGLEERISVVEV